MTCLHIAKELLESTGVPVAAYNALTACITGDATDGLGILKTDLDQILPDWRDRHETTRDGYREDDKIFLKFKTTGEHDPENIVLKRMFRTEFKRQNPFNFERKTIIK